MSLLDNEIIIIVKPSTGTWIKGHYSDGTKVCSYAYASVQPINDNELQNLQEGDRIKGTLKFYSESEMISDYFLRRKNENVKKVITCTVDNVLDSTDYTCTINGTEFLFNSGVGATAESIVIGIVSEIEGGSEPIAVVDNLDGTYTITASFEGSDYTLVVDDNQSINVDIANITKEYKCMQDKDYSAHNIAHYKAYGFLVERQNGL